MKRTIYVRDVTLWQDVTEYGRRNEISVSSIIETALNNYMEDKRMSKTRIVEIRTHGGVSQVLLVNGKCLTMTDVLLAELGWQAGQDIGTWK
jgi:hypothetical protein